MMRMKFAFGLTVAVVATLAAVSAPACEGPASACAPAAPTCHGGCVASRGGAALPYQQWRLETLLTRARAQLNAGKVAEALVSLRRAQDIGLWDGRLQSLLGEVYLRQEEWQQAAMALRRATGSETDRRRLAQALTATGLERLDWGRQEDALRLWNEALVADPGYAPAHNALGIAHLRTKEAGPAEARFRRATELDHNLSAAWSNYGVALLAQGRLEGAEAATLKALALAPDDATALSNLAFIRFERGETREAVELWRRSVELNGALADAWAGLGVGLWRLGEDQVAARRAYNRAVVRDRDYLNIAVMASRHFWPPAALETATEIIRARAAP